MTKLLFAMLAFVSVSASGHDCRKGADRVVLERARASILEAAPVRSTMGEFPTPAGTPECVRYVFSISPWGRAINVEVADSSGNLAFEMAAFDALRNYRFRFRLLSLVTRYTLVFEGVDNKIPPS